MQNDSVICNKCGSLKQPLYYGEGGKPYFACPSGCTIAEGEAVEFEIIDDTPKRRKSR